LAVQIGERVGIELLRRPGWLVLVVVRVELKT
jgi:hypothetical protein